MYFKKLNFNGVEYPMETVIVGDTDPDGEVEGNLGQLYFNSATGVYFKCTYSEDGVYSWEEFSAISFDEVVMDEDTRMLHFYKDGVDVVDPVYIAGGGGGGGGSGGGNNAILTLTNTTGWLSKTVNVGADCRITLSWSSLDNDIETGAGTLVVRVNNVIKKTLDVSQGDVTVNLTDVLSLGSNKVKISVSDAYENTKSMTFTIKTIELKIASSFSTSGEFTAGNVITYTYIPYGAVEKVVHFVVDGEEVATQTVTASGKQQSFPIPGMAHGAHSLSVYYTVNIDDEDVPSNVLNYDLIVVGESDDPIIASAFRISDVDQYTTVNIPYRVYTPNSLTSAVALYRGQSKLADLSVDRTEQTWSVRLDTPGQVNLYIRSGTAVFGFNITVRQSDIQADPEESSLALYLSSAGRSNNEAHPEVWADTEHNISCTLSDFNFVSNGWVMDKDGVTVLRVSGDARVTIPYKPFQNDFRATGKTFEIEFASRDVLDYDAVLVSCWSGERGFKLTPQLATMKSEQTQVSMQYKEDEHVRVSFVAEKRTENRLMYIYVNGVMSGVVRYPDNDDFSQQTPVNISIGADGCTTDIYCIRVYDNNLLSQQILNNWIADTQDVATMLARFTHNDVYDEYGSVVISKLPSDLPYMVIRAAELPQYKGDKKTVSGYYVDPVNGANSFTFEGCQANVQGTSSAPYARKNYDLQFKEGFEMSGGGHSDDYILHPSVKPFNRFVLKADVASSESANNVELVKLFCEADPYKRPEELADSKVRKGIYGFPIVLFWEDSVDGTITFMGKYNFNLPKRAPGPYGYSGDMESWEFQNNTSDLMLFKTATFDETMRTDTDTGDTKEAWRFDYEARFPEDTWTDYSKLQELHTFILSTYRDQATGDALGTSYTDVDGTVHTVDNAAYRLAKFRTEFKDYAEVDSFIFYYIFTELFLMVDSRAKNLFIGFSGGPATGMTAIDRKAVAEPYDMDTAIGTNNEGSLVFGYSLEDTDHLSGGAAVFNGQESVLWNNVRDAFPVEIAQMYQRLRSEGILSYASVETRFEDHQAKWPEAIFNSDSQFKYLDPLVNPDPGKAPTSVYLSMLQGSKAEQRKWWLYNRFRYMDSKWNAGDALLDVIQLRGYAKADITVTPYADIYPTVKYGSYTVSERGEHGVPTTLECPLDSVNDTEIYIYSAPQIASVGDLSGLKVGFADFSKATKLQSIKVGSNAAGYTNQNLTELHVGTNPLLGSVDARNCTALSGTVDLSGAANIEHVYLDGTAVTACSLPNGGILKTLHLPDTITNLTVRNQAGITDFTMSDYSNITTLRVENSPSIPILDILEDMAANSRVRIIGLTLTVEGTEDVEDFYDYLDTMRGLDESGNNVDTAVVSGTITGLGSITGAWLAEMMARYPNIRIEYEHITSYLRYYNHDGTTLIQEEEIHDGGNGTYSGTPSRTATAQYTFYFVGWNRKMNQTAAEVNCTKNVTGDRNVYAAYSATLRTYTVRFYNGSTLLETFTDVPYGGSVEYTGEDPVSSDPNLAFDGWNPTGQNIQGNTDCMAVFKDTSSPFIKYLNGTLTEYVSETAETICDYAFYNRTNLVSVETTASSIGESAFEGCANLESVDLTGADAVAIGAKAFSRCSKLDTVYVRADSVGTLDSDSMVNTPFDGGFGVFYVKDSLVSSYKAATNWSTYFICLISAYPVTDFSTISDTWAEIFAAEQDGTYSSKYSVGDIKKFILGDSEEVYMQIAAMDADALADDSGNAKITWISKNQLADNRRMNRAKVTGTEGTGTLGGWEKCEMRSYLRETIFPDIPQEIRNAIKTVKKYSCIYTTAEAKQTDVMSEDTVWIPSDREVFDGTSYESSAPVYSDLFNNNTARKKAKVGSSATLWFLRSTYSPTSFRVVSVNGTFGNNTASVSSGVALGFCT